MTSNVGVALSVPAETGSSLAARRGGAQFRTERRATRDGLDAVSIDHPDISRPRMESDLTRLGWQRIRNMIEPINIRDPIG
ncbi:hypothetical protein B296_00048952 [Ensete ventricosum]|uniref:Uncharacterized protein n=1 Tax=Ensete ventricosum TaxID=4639 RepID=A0A426YSP9_ENSVE|nr:hypothetical protein B296_00048952 [Ensete ventricosum]